MENQGTNAPANIDERQMLTNKIHKFLAHSYFNFFALFLVGMALDLFYPIKIFKHDSVIAFGYFLLLFATFLIFWAQHTARKLDGGSPEDFLKGPYAFTRSPTHWGLFILVLGFGIVANAFFIVITTIISFIISKFTFLKKQEKVLEEKYGAAYLEYKKKVKL